MGTPKETVMQDRICLNLSALIHLDLQTQLEASAGAGFRAVGLRSINVENFLAAGRSLKIASSLLEEFGLKSIEYNYFPNWIYCDEHARRAMLLRFDTFCSQAAALGTDNSILVAGTLFDGGNDVLDYELAARNLREIARVARTYNLIVGIEFLPWTRIDSVGKAWTLVREVDADNIGIVLDSFHYFEGSSTVEELHSVPADSIVLCHLNDMDTFDGDILTRTREQRVLPGEGQYRNDEILRYLEDDGYTGYYSLEVLNKGYREMDPLEIAQRCRKSMEDLLSAYS